jgi:hypothetical protein
MDGHFTVIIKIDYIWKNLSSHTLRKLVQMVILLTCVLEVLSSNLGRGNDYPDEGFLWYSLVPPGRVCRNTSYSTMTASFYILYSSSFVLI